MSSDGLLLAGRYETLGVLNKGSYGLVTLVREVNTREIFAAKCIKGVETPEPTSATATTANASASGYASEMASRYPTGSGSDWGTRSVSSTPGCTAASARTTAANEIMIHERLGVHPHVPSLIDHFDTENGTYLVMEYCAGGDLYEAIRSGDVSTPRRVSEIIFQLIDAVEFCHSKGVYHRDIKPENILIGADGSVKLADWGLATTHRACKDFGAGSKQYMAPECFDRRISSYDAAQADIWAVGLCLLNGLFGRNPFKVANQHDRLFTDYAATREALYDIFPTLSHDVFVALRYSLTIDPENRSLDGLKNALLGVRMWTTDDELDQLRSEPDEDDQPPQRYLDTEPESTPIAITIANANATNSARPPLRVPSAVAMSQSPLSYWDRRMQFTPPGHRWKHPARPGLYLDQLQEADTEDSGDDRSTSSHRLASLSSAGSPVSISPTSGYMRKHRSSTSSDVSADGSHNHGLGDVFSMDEVGAALHSPAALTPPSLCESGPNDPDSEDSKEGPSADTVFAGSAPTAYAASWADEDDGFWDSPVLASMQYSKSVSNYAKGVRPL